MHEDRPMPKTDSEDHRRQGEPKRPPMDRPGRRSSPSNEGEDEEGAADLQPDDVENGEPAR
jgi:hypothetical protein